MKKIIYTLLMIAINVSSNYSQQASEYFPTDTGHKWMFRLTLLDSLNQPVPSAVTFKVDSFALTSNYLGREAKYVVSKSGPENILPSLPYTDSVFLSLSNTDAFEYYRNGGFGSVLSLLDSLGLDSSFSFLNLFESFQGWYSKYRLGANVNSNYTIFSYDTSITFDSTTLPLRFSFRGKRLNDENLQTQIGTFDCKKFVMSNIISYVVTIPPFPPVAFPILTFDDSIWIAPSNWILKEFAPSTNVDLSILGFPSFTIPGYTSDIMTIPTSVNDDTQVVTDFVLNQNYPNPFNPVTKIKYSIPTSPQSPPSKGGEAKQGWFTVLKVFDVLGNEVATLVNENKPAGTYEVEFQSTAGSHKLSSGVYYYQLKVGGFTQSKKMVFLK